MTRNNQRKVWLVIVLIWMGVIFSFSHTPAIQSQELSTSFTYKITKMVNFTPFLNVNEQQVLNLTKLFDHPMRKAAHMTEYGILSILLLMNFRLYGRIKRPFLIALIFAFLYAATDEFHQLFIPGRSGQITDVFIDTIGALLGLLFFRMIHLTKMGKIKMKQERKNKK